MDVERGGRVREGLAAAFSDEELDVRDRQLSRELVSGVQRHRAALDHVLGLFARRPLSETDASVVAALRLGAYQLLYLDRVPARAAVHATVEALKQEGPRRAAGFVNAVLRKVAKLVEGRGERGAERRSLPRGDGTWVRLTDDVLPDPADDPAVFLSIAWSHPRWLVERLLEQYGREATLSVLEYGLARPPLNVRPVEGARERLEAALRESGVEFAEEGRCLRLEGGGRVEQLPGFEEGWFAVQDVSAAEVVPALDVPEGAGVLELCAAPGGKTLQLAERVGADGAVLAVDSSGPRLERLRTELERRGLRQVAVLEADATDPENLPVGLRGRPVQGFDRVLLDVPCSNTGVLGRRVEARWRVESSDRVLMLAEQAEHLLYVAASRVAPGGLVAYSTCSVDRAENEDVVRRFLAEDPEFQLVVERATLPVAGRHDGGYHAVLRRAAADRA